MLCTRYASYVLRTDPFLLPCLIIYYLIYLLKYIIGKNQGVVWKLFLKTIFCFLEEKTLKNIFGKKQIAF